MRTFICIEIPEKQKNDIIAWVNKNRIKGSCARWVKPETMHITLKFCGENEPSVTESLLKSLSEIKQKEKIILNIEGTGSFPGTGDARVIWAGIKGDTGYLRRLAEKVDKAALKAGIPAERRPFSPHITLARIPQPAPVHCFINTAAQPLITEPWEVKEIILMKSELFPTGPIYTPLGLFKTV